MIPLNYLKTLKNICKLISILIVAIFIWGAVAIKSTLRVQREKNNVNIELAHTPKENARWIRIVGTSPMFNSSSLMQSEGVDCPILHRMTWRNVPLVGILEVEVTIVDGDFKTLEYLNKKIILGPDPEGE